MVMADQLDCKPASARPPLPPQDPAASAAWHRNNGLALPDHLQTKAGQTPQGTGLDIDATPTEPTGTHQADPQTPPALYTNIPMGDIEDTLDWELDPSLGHP
jgi:hypothetical protein